MRESRSWAKLPIFQLISAQFQRRKVQVISVKIKYVSWMYCSLRQSFQMPICHAQGLLNLESPREFYQNMTLWVFYQSSLGNMFLQVKIHTATCCTLNRSSDFRMLIMSFINSVIALERFLMLISLPVFAVSQIMRVFVASQG